MRALSFVLVALAVAGAIACGSTTNPSNLCQPVAAAVTINANDNITFTPDSVDITAAQTVCFQNAGSIQHFVIGSDTDSVHVLRSDLSSGATYVHTFTAAGRFPYHCRIHGLTMSGVIKVN
jgi:plastocyanin